MGAADVVPFIPIDGVTIEDCVAMARHVGAEIWKRFQIPVYLYEAAATSPERQNLENIRRGQFEGIRADIATNPASKPDFGDARSAFDGGCDGGGSAQTADRLQRFSQHAGRGDREEDCQGGALFERRPMRYVKGAGFLVRGLAQVSMNLTDFEQTPVASRVRDGEAGSGAIWSRRR